MTFICEIKLQFVNDKNRLGDNTFKFELASKDLYNATVSLKEVLKGNDIQKKDEAIQNVHLMYQESEAIF